MSVERVIQYLNSNNLEALEPELKAIRTDVLALNEVNFNTPEKVAVLRHLSHSVHTLDLYQGNIDDVPKITALQGLRLRTLGLGSNGINEVDKIEALQHLRVENLDLSSNGINTQEKIEALQCLQVQGLDLRGNEINTELTITALRNLKTSIHTLDLRECGIYTTELMAVLTEVVKNNYHLTNVIVENPSPELTAQLAANRQARANIRGVVADASDSCDSYMCDDLVDIIDAYHEPKVDPYSPYRWRSAVMEKTQGTEIFTERK